MALTLAGAVFATELNQEPPLSADDPAFLDKCPEEDQELLENSGFTVLWHFVLTSPDADSGHLDATFSDPADTATNVANTPKGDGALHWWILNDSMTLESAETTDVSGTNLVLSHTCIAVQDTPSPTPTLPEDTATPTLPVDTATPTLPPTATSPGSPASPTGTNINLVLGLIVLVAGGLTAFAMRPKRASVKR